ncbi:MAG: hypothetical protein ACREBE_02880 [bacterium]
MVLGVALMGSVVAMPATDQRMMISGRLEVLEEDLHGDAKTLQIVSPELGAFRIVADRSGDKLLPHAGQWATVFGHVEMLSGVRVVYVDGFRLLRAGDIDAT